MSGPEEESIQATPHILPVADEKTFVVFDSATGEIAHIHRVVTFSGAQPRPAEEQELQALEYAGQFGRAATSELRLLRADRFETHIPQRVDLKTLKLTRRTV